MGRVLTILIVIAVFAVVILGLQNGWFEATHYNVILISVDTLRPDHLGCYGYRLPTSPTIDALVARGVRFEQAVCQMPTTAPSFCSILTGTYPHTHGSLENGIPLLDDVETLAEVLKSQGYHTAGFVSSYTVSDESSGLARGFEVFDDDFDGKERKSDLTNERVFSHLDSLPGGPLFLWVHYFEPHGPYLGHSQVWPASRFQPLEETVNTMDDAIAPVPKWVLKEKGLEYAIHLYDGEIAYADHRIGELLAELAARGLLESSLIVFLADHGESFEHGLYARHGFFLYESSVRIPLALVFPEGKYQGRTIHSLVQSINVVPTICDFLGAPVPDGCEGHSMMPLIKGKEGNSQVTFIERRQYEEKNAFQAVGNQYAMRVEGWKYIHATDGEDELYDLRTDPDELRNVIAEEPARASEMLGYLEAWIAAGRADYGTSPELDEEAREKLKALGYIQ
jgi:arylsulfatase A-like enzyme